MREHPEAEATSDSAQDLDVETVPTSAADIASAGRSCVAILVLVGAIVVLVVIWVVVRSLGGSP